jgi:hypothetical protein
MELSPSRVTAEVTVDQQTRRQQETDDLPARVAAAVRDLRRSAPGLEIRDGEAEVGGGWWVVDEVAAVALATRITRLEAEVARLNAELRKPAF